MSAALPYAHLPVDQWLWVSEHVPIACVDVLPVRCNRAGAFTHMGLIRRSSPMGELWCHIGGRIIHNETLFEAARRHLATSISPVAALVRMDDEPFFVNQYFPVHKDDMGYDPRKHAVASCFTAEFADGGPITAIGGEALEFRWFTVDDLPGADLLWPGCQQMIRKAQAHVGGQDELVVYEAVNARYISHNELMWQTPVLAMTAMAFLLTIALGSSRDWMRALAAALSATIAVISAQLMAKHSSSQIIDAEELWSIEKRRHMLPVHAPPSRVPVPLRQGGLNAWFASKRSRVWWSNGMLLFAAVSAAVCVLAILGV